MTAGADQLRAGIVLHTIVLHTIVLHTKHGGPTTMTTRAQTYRAASRQLLAQGWSELEPGDLRPASEKGWGTAAPMLPAVAQARGWEHQGHATLRRVVGRLADETGDAEVRRLFRVAISMHTNFYEDQDDADHVSAGLIDVGRFLGKLDRLHSPL